MKVKAVDIARELNISKATVSLALNNKPGVSEDTKRAVLACRERLRLKSLNGMEITRNPKTTGALIKILIISRNLKIARDAELDLWTDVNAVFDKMAKDKGYTLGVSYIDILSNSQENMEKECNDEHVAGVVLIGTELTEKDLYFVKGIHKPMVISDTDMRSKAYHTVLINNRQGVEDAVDYLVKYDHRDILYLANSVDIYNYTERRKGFLEALNKHGISTDKNRIITMGAGIENVYQNIRKYLDANPLPEAFIMESYHLSVGAIRAFKERNIRIPEDISIVGIDELPGYMTGECQLTTIRIPHTERAVWLTMALFRELEENITFKSKILTNCQLLEGNSVKKI